MYDFHISDTSEDIWNADMQEKACKSKGVGRDSNLLSGRGSSFVITYSAGDFNFSLDMEYSGLSRCWAQEIFINSMWKKDVKDESS